MDSLLARGIDMPQRSSRRMLTALLLTACASAPLQNPLPPPPPLPGPVLPHVEVRVFRELPGGATEPWGTLPLPPGTVSLPEGAWFVEPSAPVRTDEEARALADLLRTQGVHRLSLRGVELPAPRHLTLMVEKTGLTALYLSGTPTTDAHLEALSFLPALEILLLDGTRVTDAGMEDVARLLSLSVLNLANTSIGDAGLTLLPESVTVLVLARTHVTEAGLPVLERMSHLRQVNLRDTAISVEALQRVSRQSHIHWLWGAQ
ncbi:hypothetical protein [Hyalangium versicolor]|uniref:hypothetical protein n=1 Tax=Hyalangium versicolor TaxID=2861190 RepID=UPI001CCB05C4|nr:hypothetical protein [Hyalangium versicolor]